MNSDRPYRKSRGAEEAIDVIRKGVGSQWDSEMVQAMLHHADNPEPD